MACALNMTFRSHESRPGMIIMSPVISIVSTVTINAQFEYYLVACLFKDLILKDGVTATSVPSSSKLMFSAQVLLPTL